MQLLPHGDLGKGIVGIAPDGFDVPSAGIVRMLLAFGMIIVLAWLFDATAGPSKSDIAVTGFPTQQGRVE